MNLLYKFLILIFICSFNYTLASDKVRGVSSYTFTPIDAATNAIHHCSLGNIYFQENNYVAALKEYEIAYRLNPDSRFSASYLYNMAKCYMLYQKYDIARSLIERAISKDYINITYYNALADCILAQGTIKKDISGYLNDNSNPYNRIIVGLIYLKTNKIREARTIFDDFVSKNPDMLMTDDIRNIIRNL